METLVTTPGRESQSRVYRLPMRDGNNIWVGMRQPWKSRVYRLPMRDGNGKRVPYRMALTGTVYRLPMRDGNS